MEKRSHRHERNQRNKLPETATQSDFSIADSTSASFPEKTVTLGMASPERRTDQIPEWRRWKMADGIRVSAGEWFRQFAKRFGLGRRGEKKLNGPASEWPASRRFAFLQEAGDRLEFDRIMDVKLAPDSFG